MRKLRPFCALAVAAVAAGCNGDVVELGTGQSPADTGTSGSGPAAGAGGEGGGAGSAGGGAAGTAASAGSGGGGTAGAAAGSGGGTGRLRFENASPVAELDTEDIEDNPTLTADGLQIFFTSNRDGNADVWFATRARSTDLFGEPQPLDAANTESDESSPAISLDGLSLFVGQDEQDGGLGGLDIWVLERSSRGAAWSSPANVFELNSPEDDIPRPPAMDDTVMPLGSRRSMEGYRTYLANRADPESPFEEPLLIEELAVPGQSTIDGFLTEDGLMLFFCSAASENAGDLYYATRPSTDEPFGEPTAITDLNTVADERDPWLSPDETRLYFSTDREGTLDIYVATVTRE